MKELMGYEDFRNYYLKNDRLPFPLSTPKNKLSEFQLKSKYNDYLRKMDKPKKTYQPIDFESRKNNIELAMDSFRVKNNTKPFENWFNKLNSSQQKIIKDKMWMCPTKETSEGKTVVFDVAHIISRSDSKYLADKEYNFILLPRYLHHCLDSSIDPFTYQPMNESQQRSYWVSLVGLDLMTWLESQRNEIAPTAFPI